MRGPLRLTAALPQASYRLVKLPQLGIKFVQRRAPQQPAFSLSRSSCNLEPFERSFFVAGHGISIAVTTQTPRVIADKRL